MQGKVVGEYKTDNVRLIRQILAMVNFIVEKASKVTFLLKNRLFRIKEQGKVRVIGALIILKVDLEIQSNVADEITKAPNAELPIYNEQKRSSNRKTTIRNR